MAYTYKRAWLGEDARIAEAEWPFVGGEVPRWRW